MDIALHADRLGKRYGRTWALRECSLSLPAGRIAALVGPNGAGKTTLLHLAVGLLRPDAGTIHVGGGTPYGNIALLPEIGFIAQDTPLYPDFTPAELVRLGAELNPPSTARKLRGSAALRSSRELSPPSTARMLRGSAALRSSRELNRRFDATLARTRLAGLGIPPDRPVRTLSGGQRAQVALALALAKQPRLLLLDEPLASLDPLARRDFLSALMGSVADSGTTVLLSSHLLADLERVCDHLIVLRSAQVVLAGDVEELLTHHRQLVGPLHDGTAIDGVESVVRASHTDRQSTLLVRVDGAITDPKWTVHEPGLEDLVLAYLSDAATAANHAAWGVAA